MLKMRLSEYLPALRTALVIQAITGLLVAVGMDEYLQTYLFTLAGFWAGAALVMARRRSSPTAADLSFIRIGFIPVLVLGGVLIECIWRARGLRGL